MAKDQKPPSQTPEIPPQGQPGAKMVNDPELKAMNTIGRLLGEMEQDARMRVLNYVNAKYGPSAIRPNYNPATHKADGTPAQS